MIFDDGVTLRLDDDRYFMTTTTGGAAKVLDWLEEWHQTEWPELDVVCTSVTEQWSTIAVVGPKSRAVIAKVAPQLAENGGLDAEAFPFMTFRETTLASGVQARVCRISFSGELAYEINIPVLVRTQHLGSRCCCRCRVQHHPLRHRNHARAPRRKGLPDRGAGHRRHGHPAGRRHGLDRLQGQGLHRQALLPPSGRQPRRPQAPGQRPSRGPLAAVAGRHPAGGEGHPAQPG